MQRHRPRFAVAVAGILGAGIAIGYAGAQAAGKVHRIGMAGSAYSLDTLEARVGDTIRFSNDDSEDHTVFVPTYGWGIDFGAQKPGTDVVMMLGKPGRFRVECVNHAAMLLDVTVTR